MQRQELFKKSGIWTCPIYFHGKCFSENYDFFNDGRIGFSLLNASAFSKNLEDSRRYLQDLENFINNDFERTLKIFRQFYVLIEYVQIERVEKIKFKKNLSSDDIESAINNHFGICKWLYFWNKKLNTKKLKKSYISWLEKLSIIIELRYKLIRELHSRDEIISVYAGHNSTWLLYELFLLIYSLEDNRENNEQIYRDEKVYIDKLDRLELQDTDTKPSLKNLKDTPFFIDDLAAKVAYVDDEFKSIYFEPYIKARKNYNAFTKKKPIKPIFIFDYGVKAGCKRSKPGRKIGQKAKM